MDFMDHIWYISTRGDIMIIDITGIELTPGNLGNNCNGNGKHKDAQGNPIECCCDQCDYLLCCTSENSDCKNCMDEYCLLANQAESSKI